MPAASRGSAIRFKTDWTPDSAGPKLKPLTAGVNEFFARLIGSNTQDIMNSFENLTPTKLRRAAEIKEKLQSLNNELNQIFGGLVPVTPKGGRVKRKMSPAAKAKLSAKLKAAWVKRKAAKQK